MNNESVEEKINRISINTGCQLSKRTGNFDMTYEIRNFDYEKYALKCSGSNFELNGSCEILGGTSERPSYFSGNTPSQNRYSIVCKYPLENLIPKFSIYESEFLTKLLYKKYIVIRSKDKDFLKFLKDLPEILYLEERVKKSSSVSPAIFCRKEKDFMVLSINFHSHEDELLLFEKMIFLSKKISVKIENK